MYINSMMSTTTYISLGSAIVAAFALGISILGYLLNKRLTNENRIFEEKIRAYQLLIKAMNEVINEIISAVDKYIDLKTQRVSDLKNKGNNLHGDIDDAINAYEDAINDNTLFLPDEVLEKLYGFLVTLDKPEYMMRFSKEKEFDQLKQELQDYFDDVIDVMREDLDFEKLDEGLKRRIGGFKIGRRQTYTD